MVSSFLKPSCFGFFWIDEQKVWNKHKGQKEYIDRHGVHVIVGQYMGGGYPWRKPPNISDGKCRILYFPIFLSSILLYFYLLFCYISIIYFAISLFYLTIFLSSIFLYFYILFYYISILYSILFLNLNFTFTSLFFYQKIS